jgi:hypothetical protein
MRCSEGLKFRQGCADSSRPRGVSSQVGKWRAGAEGRRLGEGECVLASGGMTKCEIPAKLKGRDGSRPCARCLMEVANQLDEYMSE